LFVIYLGELWPGATGTATRVAIITLLLGSLAIANIIGTRAAASVSTATVIAKVAPLVILVAFVTIKGAEPAVLPSHTGETKNALEAFLLITFLYGGFESGLMSLGEVKNPRRSVVVALAVGLATCALLFTAVQWAVVHTIGAAPSARPVADAASRVLGYPGGIAVSIVALISMYGYLSAQMLNVPRLTYALATGGDFPAFFARIHPRFRTPYSSVALFAIIVWILAVFGTYRYAIGVSSGARIIVYGTVCAALLALRRKFPNAPAFRIPGAPVIGVIAMIVLIAPLTQLKREEVIITAVVIALAAVFWLLTRRRSSTT
jgi:amino acid transporter